MDRESSAITTFYQNLVEEKVNMEAVFSREILVPMTDLAHEEGLVFKSRNPR